MPGSAVWSFSFSVCTSMCATCFAYIIFLNLILPVICMWWGLQRRVWETCRRIQELLSHLFIMWGFYSNSNMIISLTSLLVSCSLNSQETSWLTLWHLTTHIGGPTAPLISKRCILYICSTNTGTEYFKHGIYSPFFSLQNAVCFIILMYLVPVLFTFYIQVC